MVVVLAGLCNCTEGAEVEVGEDGEEDELQTLFEAVLFGVAVAVAVAVAVITLVSFSFSSLLLDDLE